MFIYEQCVHVLIILQLNQQQPIFFLDHAAHFRPDGLEPETYFEGQFAGQSANASSPFSAMLLRNQPTGYPTHPDLRQD